MYFKRSFYTLQKCLVPLCEQLTESERQASFEFIADFITKKPKIIRIKLLLFLFYIDIEAFLCGARSFEKLPPQKQNNLLSKLFSSRVSLIRKGFWGLNTLAKMSVYGQPFVYPLIGYHPKTLTNEN